MAEDTYDSELFPLASETLIFQMHDALNAAARAVGERNFYYKESERYKRLYLDLLNHSVKQSNENLGLLVECVLVGALHSKKKGG